VSRFWVLDDHYADVDRYSNIASTAKETPRNRANATMDISHWSPSPVKRKGKTKIPSPKPIISSPLPLFTPTTPSRLGLDPTLPRPNPNLLNPIYPKPKLELELEV
jgi:hypothetical protein